MSRISSVTYLDFILVNRLLENAEQNLIWQNILISDVAWWVRIVYSIRSCLQLYRIITSKIILQKADDRTNKYGVFIASCNTSRTTISKYREDIYQRYTRDLQSLFRPLPLRFHFIIQKVSIQWKLWCLFQWFWSIAIPVRRILLLTRTLADSFPCPPRRWYLIAYISLHCLSQRYNSVSGAEHCSRVQGFPNERHSIPGWTCLLRPEHISSR